MCLQKQVPDSNCILPDQVTSPIAVLEQTGVGLLCDRVVERMGRKKLEAPASGSVAAAFSAGKKRSNAEPGSAEPGSAKRAKTQEPVTKHGQATVSPSAKVEKAQSSQAPSEPSQKEQTAAKAAAKRRATTTAKQQKQQEEQEEKQRLQQPQQQQQQQPPEQQVQTQQLSSAEQTMDQAAPAGPENHQQGKETTNTESAQPNTIQENKDKTSPGSKPTVLAPTQDHSPLALASQSDNLTDSLEQLLDNQETPERVGKV
jgi:hypothetical protein